MSGKDENEDNVVRDIQETDNNVEADNPIEDGGTHNVDAEPEGDQPEANGEADGMDDGARRPIKHTEKGLQYQLEIYAKGLKYAMSVWKRSMISAERGIGQVTDIRKLRQFSDAVNDALAQVNVAADKYRELSKDDLYDMETIEDDALSCMKRITQKIIDQELETRSVRTHHSVNTTRPKRTNASSMSNDSDKSYMSFKAQTAAKIAAAKARLKYIDVEAKQESALEKTRLQRQLHVAEAELDAIASVEGDGLDPHNIHSKIDKDTQIQSRMCESTPPPGQINDLAELFAAQVNLGRLPPPEPTVFRGDPLKFSAWWSSFEALVKGKKLDDKEKLHYLRKYVDGDAKEAIEGYFIHMTDEGYRQAIDLLQHRFGDEYTVSNAFRDKLEEWPHVGPKDASGLRRFVDFLKQCRVVMETVNSLHILNDERENHKLLRKLPDWIVLRWGRIVSKRRQHNEGFPPFSEFFSFLETEAEIANDPAMSLQALRRKDSVNPKGTPSRSKDTRSARALNTRTESVHASDSTPTFKVSSLINGPANRDPGRGSEPKLCQLCKEDHPLKNCSEFLSKAQPDRVNFVAHAGICFGCLNGRHKSRECKHRLRCEICERMHPTVLHKDEQSHKVTCSSCSTDDDLLSSRKCSMVVPVWVSNNGVEELTYALLDTQSDASFISEELYSSLGLKGTEVSLLISTMTSQDTYVVSRKVSGLTVRGCHGDISIQLPPLYTRDELPSNRSHIPTPEIAKQLPHLRHVAEYLVPLQSCGIGLLIGYNCPQALMPRDVVPPDTASNMHSPYALCTALGWSIVGYTGVQDSRASERILSHRILVQQVPSYLVPKPYDDELSLIPDEVVVCERTKVKETLNMNQVRTILESDFADRTETGMAPSVEDRRFIKILSEGIHYTKDGHYEMPLPLRKNTISLPNNKTMALKRLTQLRNRFTRDTKYRVEYTQNMQSLIDKGFAELVPEVEQSESKPWWYLPHHGVYSAKKDKIRIVFDCSARYMDTSLNDHLLSGPDCINSLTGILLRFRQELVALSCDVEQMFHQFKVNVEDRDLLRFLWWDEGDVTQCPKEYRMCVHLFGATSSPGCCTFALRYMAQEHQDKFGADVSQFIHRNFYVDDGLTSLATPHEAEDLIRRTRDLCAKGGLHLHKFSSNMDILQGIPKMDCSPNTDVLSVTEHVIPRLENVLGVQWCIENDTLGFRITLQDKPSTRRGVLSMVTSVYDPLGFIAPFLLIGKRILQELCQDDADWDAPLPEHLQTRWYEWKQDLLLLQDLEIPRCYRRNADEIARSEIHHFSDASNIGYGQCSYLRTVDDKGIVNCSFVLGKARVSPLKPITIPRLELTAALLSVRSSILLGQELELANVDEYFWSDSQITLAYINNESRRFHVFIANRVQQIQEHTTPEQWRYVRTENNPADEASRGLIVRELLSSCKWLKGPDFLWEPTIPAPVVGEHELSLKDPELRKHHILHAETQTTLCLSECFSSCSSWYRLKRLIAVWLRYRNILRNRIRFHKESPSRKKSSYQPVTVSELQEAETQIFKVVQHQVFQCDVSDLKAGRPSKGNSRSRNRIVISTSSLRKLDPFLDDNQILRVGGRLSESTMAYELRHPIILPRKHHITSLIIDCCHEKIQHQGRGITVNCIRSCGFWIIGCTSAVYQHIRDCVTCRRIRGIPQGQKMSDLPMDRVTEAAPFTYCAVDFFGPFLIREGRKEVKRYGSLFTCLACRAVHIELADTLSTDSFMNALRRFVCIRGPVRTLRCDRGTNFVSAQSELDRAFEEMDHDTLKMDIGKMGCDYIHFKMNVPHASHQGGVWERQIRSTRNVLSVLMDQSSKQLNDETLRTFMAEAMAIVNSRPLTVDHLSDPMSPTPISPNQLLTMKGEIILPPPGNFVKEDLYCRRWWRRVQFLSNQFWSRWKKEYLQNIQVRSKWQGPQRNIQEGDVVLLKEESAPRCQWPMGMVDKVVLGTDSKVRAVTLRMGDRTIDKNGRRISSVRYFERPIHKLVLLCEA